MAFNSAENPVSPGFLSLPPDIRNIIYELVDQSHKSPNKTIAVTARRGRRSIPSPLSRTCRQIRHESRPYFFNLNLVSFIIQGIPDLIASREWLEFVPESAWQDVKAVTIDHTHCSPPSFMPCCVYFELNFNEIESISIRRARDFRCSLCDHDVEAGTIAKIGTTLGTIDLVLKDMLQAGTLSGAGVGVILDILQELTS